MNTQDDGRVRCPRCGAEYKPQTPGGVCPACAFGEALTDPSAEGGASKLCLEDIPVPAGQGVVAKEGAADQAETIVVSGILEEKPGSRIGHYKLLQQIGEGGCGVVYMAEQEEPIRRRVAFKVIKLGMDTRQVIARFEAERQALALMDHPNIAKVLDAGVTETGRPYFVMELVRGIKITDYCDQNNLSTEQRLDLFIQVCHAIPHAHQKGIIHRDIKPSNILVTVNDGVPVPKVIDFGIAKATGGQVLTDKTLFTAFEQFIGTPAYMSPEQAEMSGLDIDTRSDIYALGVLLYELLTGKTPFDAKELIQAGLEGMRRIIREQEPSRPSTKISTLGAEEQTTIAKCRQVEAPKLIHQVRGDLDWIVMKCLEKDRTRRYEGASGLAQEIERHLNHEPVSAGAPSAIYRLRKFARRHRAAMAMAAVVFGLLLTGITAVLWQWRQTEAARRNAVQAEQAEARESYAAKLALATAKVESGQLSRAREILASCPPHLRHWEWYWLNNSGEAEPKVLEGHLTEVTALAFTPDSQRLVTAHLGAPLVWNVDSGQRLASSSAEPVVPWPSSYPWLALANDGKAIVTVPKLCQSGTDQRQVRIWETASGRQLRSLWLTNWVETMSGRGNRIFLRNTTNQPPGYTVLEPTTGRVVASLMATGEFAFRFSNFVNAEETDSCVNPRLPAVSADGRWLLTQTLNKVPNPRPGEAARSKGSGAILILPLMDRPRPPDNQGLRFQWTVWDVDQAQPLARLPESEAPLVFAAFSPDGKILFTWDHSFSEDPDQSHGRCAFWETSTGRQVSTFSLPGRTHYFHSRAVFSGDGRRLLIARNTSPEWPVEVWDVRSGRLVSSLLKYDGELGALALSPDGSVALTADHIVRLWDATKGTELTSFAGHADRVVCAAFSPDGRFVATGSRDKTARLWPLECGRLQMSLDANLTFSTGVDFSAKGRYALAYQYSSENGGTGSVVTVWDYTTARKISDLALAEKWEEILLLPDDVHLVALNPGNRAGSGGRAQVYELLSGRVNHTFQADQLGLAPGSGRLIGVEQRRLPGPGTSFNFLIRTWDAASGKLVATNHLVGVSLGLLSDGKHALVGVNDGQHQLWDLHRQRVVGRLSEPPRWGAAFVRFFPAQKRLLFERWDKPGKPCKMVLLDSENGRQIGAFTVGTIVDDHWGGGLFNVRAVSADGERLVASHQVESTHRLWLWETRTGKYHELIGHSGKVHSAAFFPDGARIITAGEDRTTRFWDSQTRSELFALRHPGPVSQVAVSPDGRSVLTVSQGSGAMLWRPAEWNIPTPEGSEN